jgi:hypothetical protein
MTPLIKQNASTNSHDQPPTCSKTACGRLPMQASLKTNEITCVLTAISLHARLLLLLLHAGCH